MVGINIKQELKDKLDNLKQHERDTYGMVIERLVQEYKISKGTIDKPTPEESMMAKEISDEPEDNFGQEPVQEPEATSEENTESEK